MRSVINGRNPGAKGVRVHRFYRLTRVRPPPPRVGPVRGRSTPPARPPAPDESRTDSGPRSVQHSRPEHTRANSQLVPRRPGYEPNTKRSYDNNIQCVTRETIWRSRCAPRPLCGRHRRGRRCEIASRRTTSRVSGPVVPSRAKQK